MRIAVVVTALFTCSFLSTVYAADLPAPSTTLTAETSNNTSASPSFAAQVNGNLGAGNISKVPTRSLLYPGATTKIYAHVEPWWGSSKHIDIGYSSQDPSQVHRQVQDMISRGLDGVVADWYGPDSYEAPGVKLLVAEAEANPGFGVFVEVEHGAVLWDSCYPTCNATTAVIQLFSRVASDFFVSPAYVRIGGRPVLREFAMESIPLPSGQTDTTWNKVDWNAVQAQVPGNPLVLHRNLNGFAKPQSGGAYAWMEPKTLANEPPNYDGTDELVWFYSNAVVTYPNQPAFGAVWKGFNDILASWAPSGGRHIEQNCGQTWLNTFATANRYYSATNQLAGLQLVTWNDYEEGTELETGIDNCLTVSASLSGTSLQWTITGDESTLDHYTLFISTDGENLAVLGNFATGSRAVDLSAFAIPAGGYSLFLKAVGKPSLRNQMSAPVALTIAPPPPPTAATKDLTISASPSSASVTRGQSGQFAINIAESGASDPVTLSCSNVPAGATCSFAPSSLTPSTQGSSVALAISTSAMIAAHSRHVPTFAFWLPAVVGLVFLPGLVAVERRKGMSRRAKQGIDVLVLAVIVLTGFACGGTKQTQSAAVQSSASAATVRSAAIAYSISVTATSGTVTRSTIINLTVQ